MVAFLGSIRDTVVFFHFEDLAFVARYCLARNLGTRGLLAALQRKILYSTVLQVLTRSGGLSSCDYAI